MHIFDITPETGMMELTYPKSSWKKPHELYLEGTTTSSLYAQMTGRNKFAKDPGETIYINFYDLRTAIHHRSYNLVASINPTKTSGQMVEIYYTKGKITKEIFDELFLSSYRRVLQKGRLEFLIEIITKLEQKYTMFESVNSFTPVVQNEQENLLKKYSFLKNI